MNIKAAVITVSDKASRGEREDRGGPALIEFLKSKDVVVAFRKIVPDEKNEIKAAIRQAQAEGCDLILTTGGTGFAPRDVTPEATLELIEKYVPGIPEFIRIESAKKTKNAVLSRAVCGIIGGSVVLNLPGKPAGAVESLEIVWDQLYHGLEILKGVIGEHA